MNENIDLTKILYGCPEGTKFYSTIFGEITFVGICFSSNYPIMVKVYDKYNDITINESFTKDGEYAKFYDGECLFFPSKDQRDWSKFVRFWDKPKVERFNPKTFQPFDKVLVRYNKCSPWIPNIFGQMNDTICCCISGSWDICIPYNEKTKHLMGKINDCPEYYKWWEE